MKTVTNVIAAIRAIIILAVLICSLGFWYWVGEELYTWWFSYHTSGSGATTGVAVLDYSLSPIIFVLPFLGVAVEGLLVWVFLYDGKLEDL